MRWKLGEGGNDKRGERERKRRKRGKEKKKPFPLMTCLCNERISCFVGFHLHGKEELYIHTALIVNQSPLQSRKKSSFFYFSIAKRITPTSKHIFPLSRNLLTTWKHYKNLFVLWENPCWFLFSWSRCIHVIIAGDWNPFYRGESTHFWQEKCVH